jgi:hypothetical protein
MVAALHQDGSFRRDGLKDLMVKCKKKKIYYIKNIEK